MEADLELILSTQTDVLDLMRSTSKDELFRSVLIICRRLEALHLRLKIGLLAKREFVDKTITTETGIGIPASVNNCGDADQSIDLKPEVVGNGTGKSEHPQLNHTTTNGASSAARAAASSKHRLNLTGAESLFHLIDKEENAIDILYPEDDDVENDTAQIREDGDDGSDSNKENVRGKAKKTTSAIVRSGFSKNFKRKDDENHLMSKKIPNVKHPCAHCESNFPSRVALGKHLSQIHGRKRVFRCSRCLSTFDTGSLLDKHQKKKPKCTIHLGKKCLNCLCMIKLDKMDDHLKVCLDMRRQCEHCPKKFRKRNQLLIKSCRLD